MNSSPAKKATTSITREPDREWIKGLVRFSGAVTHGVSRSIKVSHIFCVCFIVFLYNVCRLCINYQYLSTNLLEVAALPILLLTFFISQKKIGAPDLFTPFTSTKFW